MLKFFLETDGNRKHSSFLLRPIVKFHQFVVRTQRSCDIDENLRVLPMSRGGQTPSLLDVPVREADGVLVDAV